MYYYKLYCHVEIFQKKRLLADVKAKYLISYVKTELVSLTDEPWDKETILIG